MRKLFKRIRTRQQHIATETATQSASTSVSATSHPVGYETLFEGAVPIIADIVFVHGLRGHRRDAWTKEGICWPKELLPKDEALFNVRVLTFGYDSEIVEFGRSVSLNSLFKHSISLVNGLCRERDDSLRPIIFVAHSLGGLLVKDALHHSDIHRKTQPNLSTILDATRGIVFLGTPHRGIGATTLPKVIASVIQAVQNTNVDLIRDLERDAQTLDRIGVSFGQILDRRTFTVFSFEEELAMRGTKVVDGGSALIGDPREGRDTIHADHVNMVKFSDPKDDGYRKVLYAIKVPLRLILHPAGQDKPEAMALSGPGAGSARLKGLLPIVDDFQVLTYYNVPPLHVDYYVERKKLFSRLEELLSSPSTPHQRIVVLLGMGGTGKTQLALKYCRHTKSNGKLRAIFWLDASSRNALESSMVTIFERLTGRIVPNPRDGVELVRTTLSDWSDPWLLVFDNFDKPSELPDLMTFFPDSTRGSILITSQSFESRRLGTVVELDQMEKDEALELLVRSSRIDSDDPDVTEKIVNRLGYLPLAIDQAGAYISRRQLRLVDFEEEYEKRKPDFMKEIPEIWQYRRGIDKTSLSLLTTWEMSFQLLEEHEGNLGDLLILFAFLHPTSISEVLFMANIEADDLSGSPMRIFKENGEWNHGKFERAIIFMQDHLLLRFSRRSGNEIVVSLHSMVSEWLRLRLDEGALSTSLKSVSLHLKHYVRLRLESLSLDYMNGQEALSHMDSLDRIAEFGERDDFCDIYFVFGEFYAKHDRVNDAERMYDRALPGYEKAWGPEHPSTLDTVYNLGLLYAVQGRLADAERMYNRALAGYEKAWGPEHSSTLNTINNLGILYVKHGRLADAGRMYDRALEGKEKTLGPEDTSTLDTVNNLGNLYLGQGRVADAEKMYNRALVGYEKVWGPEHSSTLDAVNNLGLLYSDEGRLADAEKMYSRALVGQEKVWGPQHTSTVNTVNNFGLLYVKQGRLADAEKMYIRALAGYEKTWGPEHTSTLNTVSNLGTLYADQGRLGDAERMHNRALGTLEKAWGPNHPSTLGTVNNLGVLYVRQGRLADAERMYNWALVGYETAWGPEHPSTLNTVNNFGNLYLRQRRLANAESMYNRALAGYEKAWGPDHSSTLDTVNNLGLLYSDQGRLADAERMYDRALAGKEKAWGPEHPSTLNTVHLLGKLYADQGRVFDAERMFKRASAGFKKALGPNHPSTLATLENLETLCSQREHLAGSGRMV